MQEEIKVFVRIAIILVVGFAVSLVILRSITFASQRAKLPKLIISPLRNIIKLLASVVVLSLVLGQFGIELMTIVTATFAMVAIGFIAVWSLLSNVTATILLVIVKPFNISDTVHFAGEETGGKVVDVNLFYTTLETNNGEFFQVPNNLFFQRVMRRKISAKGKAIELSDYRGTEVLTESQSVPGDKGSSG